jgi:hypothetical protein
LKYFLHELMSLIRCHDGLSIIAQIDYTLMKAY